MNKEYCVNIMQKWYAQRFVQYEIVMNFLLNREFSVLFPKMFGDRGGVRYLRILNPDGFTFCLKEMVRYITQQQAYNLYYSLAHYSHGLPQLNAVLRFRDVDGALTEWKNNHYKQIDAFDCLVDVDAPERKFMQAAKEDTHDIIMFFDKHKVPYYLRFSGMGYHVVIPYQFFAVLGCHFNPHDDIENNIYCLYNDISKKLHDDFTEFVDTDLHDSRRILKIPYSLAFYDDGVYVCWPFNDIYEFEVHHCADYKLNDSCHFKGEQKIFKRGQRLYNEKHVSDLSALRNMLSELQLKKWVRKIDEKTRNART